MYDTVLVPTDGSAHSVRAAEHGHYLKRLFDATVHVITVVDSQRSVGSVESGGIDPRIVDEHTAESETAIQTVETAVGKRDLETKSVVSGEPSESILEYTNVHNVDIITMGTNDRTALDRYIAGSVTERVVRHAEVPVRTLRTTDLILTDGSEPARTVVDHGLALAEKAEAHIHAVNIVDFGDATTSPTIAPPSKVIVDLESEGQTATDRIATRARERGRKGDH